MQLSQLEEKRASIQQRFAALEQSNREISSQMTTNNEELLKLSGEHRLVTELIADLTDQAKEPKKEKKNG